MTRRLSAEEKVEAASLAHMWESSKHRDASVTITVHDDTDDAGRAVYDVEIHARASLPAAGTQYPLDVEPRHEGEAQPSAG